MPSLIKIVNVSKTYRAGEVNVQALRGISVEIERGSFVAIMGPSGSGKTTFMNMLGCLDQPTAGTYLLEGEDVSGFGRNQLAEMRNSKIGFVFQQFNLLARTTAMENVELPLLYSDQIHKDSRERALKALRVVGLAGRENHFPSQLSGGQQQRVAIARALINDPSLILADEPTGALDTHSSAEIMAVLQELNRDNGITVIVVTHEPDVAQYAGRVIYFRDGKIVRDERIAAPRDAAEDLKNLPPLESQALEESRT